MYSATGDEAIWLWNKNRIECTYYKTKHQTPVGKADTGLGITSPWLTREAVRSCGWEAKGTTPIPDILLPSDRGLKECRLVVENQRSSATAHGLEGCGVESSRKNTLASNRKLKRGASGLQA